MFNAKQTRGSKYMGNENKHQRFVSSAVKIQNSEPVPFDAERMMPPTRTLQRNKNSLLKPYLKLEMQRDFGELMGIQK